MLRLCLQLEDDLRQRCVEALRRVRDIEVTENSAEAQAVITDQHAVAQSAEHALWFPDDFLEVRSSQIIMPGAEWRFRPSLQVIADRLGQGKLGLPGLLRIHRWTSAVNLLADLDIACWLFASAPETVYTVSRTGYLQTHLGFCEGGMAIIDHVSDLQSSEGYESLTMVGGDGAAYADDHHNTNLLYSSSGCQGVKTSEAGSSLVTMLNAFIAAVREEGDYPVTMADLELAHAVKKRVLGSAETKTVSTS